MNLISTPASPLLRSDIRAEDLFASDELFRTVRRLALQYLGNPIIEQQLIRIRDFLLERFPPGTEAVATEPNRGPENAPEPTEKNRRRQCSICSNARRAEIDAVLQRGTSFRQVAAQFQLPKSAVARHRRHGGIEP